MTWRLVWTRPALRDLKKLDSVIARRVRRALVTLSTTGRGDVVKLKGVRPPEWRLRIGDYRAFFQLDENERLINVLRVRDAIKRIESIASTHGHDAPLSRRSTVSGEESATVLVTVDYKPWALEDLAVRSARLAVGETAKRARHRDSRARPGGLVGIGDDQLGDHDGRRSTVDGRR